MITFDQIHKLRRGRTILENITVEVLPGRVTGLVGPNGAGKSSLLRILLGLDRPSRGRALIEGIPYARLSRPFTVVGAQLDGAGAHRARTARSHLRWIARSQQIPFGRVEEVLELIGLGSAASQRVGQYSLGMAQRLGIGAALLGDPRALILDEPMNGLDPDGIRWLRALVRERAERGCAVLLSSHLLTELEGVADDVLILRRGRLVSRSSAKQLADRCGSLEAAYVDLAAESLGTAGVIGALR
ncbi:MAG: ATP-binding cassette domain-containing protein [Tessaracoccus sp.]